MSRKILIGIYTDPQGYPPTLNAITELSTCFENIDVLYRPHIDGMWAYPVNVNLHPSGKLMSGRAQEQSRLYKKIFFFLMFTWRLLRLGLKNKPKVFLMYDYLALFSYFLVRPFFLFQHKIWYHNHDVAEINHLRKYSIGWFAAKAEKKIFPKLDIFTLPTSERLYFFEMDKLVGKVFIIPNYPATGFYNKFYSPNKDMSEVKIIYQGNLRIGSGFEIILKTISKDECKNWKLVLKGSIEDDYKNKLFQVADNCGVSDRLEYGGYVLYKNLPKYTVLCHIGIAIYKEDNAVTTTLGTASNKSYEYAALGLPVLYLANSNMANTLSKYIWAFPVELNEASIYNAVNTIMSNYEFYSLEARKSFEDDLNFESHFQPVIDYLLNKA